jgi:hypothetical protein
VANVIQIKRSVTTDTPSTLAAGELAYSETSGNFFIGTAGNSITKIGGNADVLKLNGIAAGADVSAVTSVAGRTGAVTIALSDISDFTDTNFVHVTGAESIAGDKTFSDDVIITGDLTVNGVTTTISTTNLTVSDNIIVLNKDVTGTPALNAGLEVNRGSSDAAQLLWSETDDKWGAKIGSNDFAAFIRIGDTLASTAISDFSTAVGSIVDAVNIGDLGDVLITTPTNADILKFNSTSGKWENGTTSSGVSTFIALTDVPSAYTSAGGKFLRINAGATGVEFVADPGYLVSGTATIDCGTF